MYRRYAKPGILREMDQLQREMNRLFNAAHQGRVLTTPAYPAVNLWASAEGQVVSAEMPGVRPEDIDIDVTGDALSISGVRRPDEVAQEAHYHRRERSYGTFSRTVQLPFMVDTHKVEAAFKDGVLRITLPRAEADKPRKINIQSH